jgi:hypothetical protein
MFFVHTRAALLGLETSPFAFEIGKVGYSAASTSPQMMTITTA